MRTRQRAQVGLFHRQQVGVRVQTTKKLESAQRSWFPLTAKGAASAPKRRVHCKCALLSKRSRRGNGQRVSMPGVKRAEDEVTPSEGAADAESEDCFDPNTKYFCVVNTAPAEKQWCRFPPPPTHPPSPPQYAQTTTSAPRGSAAARSVSKL